MSISTVALSVALEAANQASKVLRLAFKNQNYSKRFKGDGSPVTTADIDTQKVIDKILSESFPTFPIIGEESTKLRLGLPRSEYYWFVDPLDGTKEFIKHSDEFTVNIALVKKGRPIVGVISIPNLNKSYYAVKGCGSFRVVKGRISSISCSTRDLNYAVIVESKDHTPINQHQLMKQLPFVSKFTSGSSMKGCYVAEGSADLYLRMSPFWYWDVCAQDCIVTEAGGSCTDLEGSIIQYKQSASKVSGVVISNNTIQKKILSIINN